MTYGGIFTIVNRAILLNRTWDKRAARARVIIIHRAPTAVIQHDVTAIRTCAVFRSFNTHELAISPDASDTSPRKREAAAAVFV